MHRGLGRQAEGRQRITYGGRYGEGPPETGTHSRVIGRTAANLYRLPRALKFGDPIGR